MVTLAGTQNFNEFELHLRAVLGLPIPGIILERKGVSAVILAGEESANEPSYSGFEKVSAQTDTDFRIFGKPTTRTHRRMGVIIVYGDLNSDTNELRKKAAELASEIKLTYK